MAPASFSSKATDWSSRIWLKIKQSDLSFSIYTWNLSCLARTGCFHFSQSDNVKPVTHVNCPIIVREKPYFKVLIYIRPPSDEKNSLRSRQIKAGAADDPNPNPSKLSHVDPCGRAGVRPTTLTTSPTWPPVKGCHDRRQTQRGSEKWKKKSVK